MKIVWSPLAIQRVQEIADYIALDSMNAAEKWIDSVFDKVETLVSAPEIGRIVPELEKSDLRELIFGNYRIIYQLFPKRIFILTVRHFKQLLPTEEFGM